MYRTVETSFWDDPKVAQLGIDAVFLALYLVTNPNSHVSGLFIFRQSLAVEQTQIPLKRIEIALDKLIKRGFCKFDSERKVIWVINMLKRQYRHGLHKARIANHLATLYETPLIDEFLEKYKEYSIPYHPVTNVSPSGHQDAPRRTADQEQDQDQEQDHPPNPLVGGEQSNDANETQNSNRGRRRLPPACKDPVKLAEILDELEVSSLPALRKTYEPQGLDMDAWWRGVRRYVIKGSASKPFPNPANWRDWPAALRNSCEGAIQSGRYTKKVSLSTNEEAFNRCTAEY